jgi:hypothetical protein
MKLHYEDKNSVLIIEFDTATAETTIRIADIGKKTISEANLRMIDLSLLTGFLNGITAIPIEYS